MTDDEHKVERIGKKYQWIALVRLLGYVSDHYHMRPDWGGEPQTYQCLANKSSETSTRRQTQALARTPSKKTMRSCTCRQPRP